jgi:hypothetical protein
VRVRVGWGDGVVGGGWEGAGGAMREALVGGVELEGDESSDEEDEDEGVDSSSKGGESRSLIISFISFSAGG